MDEDDFICPECGSKEAGDHMMVSKEPLTEKNNETRLRIKNIRSVSAEVCLKRDG